MTLRVSVLLCDSAPEQRHTGADIEILKQHEALYQRAKQAQPERWSGNTRDWSYIDVVRLNSDKAETKKLESTA